MYQPYPGSAQIPEVQRPPAPASVLTAVKIMYAGAVASLITMLIELTTLNATKRAFQKSSPKLTASQLNTTQHTLTLGWIAGGLIAIGLWIFIARACKAGKNWARITGTVFFGIATLDLFGYVAAPFAVPVKIFAFVVWLAGLGAVVFLWRGTSSAFFKGTPS